MWFKRNIKNPSIIYNKIRKKNFSARKEIRHKIPGKVNAIRKTFSVNNPSQAMRIKIGVYPWSSFTHAIWLLFNKPLPSKKQLWICIVTHAENPCQQSCNVLLKGIEPKNITYSFLVLPPESSEYCHLCHIRKKNQLQVYLFFVKQII